MTTKHITICPYNPNWPHLFEAEARRLQDTLWPHLLEIHHIGSTAVPNLSAKEDLDIVGVVDQLSSALALQNIGYKFKGELNIPLRYFFSKNTPECKVNLHIVEADHGFKALNLSFRDYLRTHDEARQAYQDLKYHLIQDPTSFERVDGKFPRYTLKKHAFIISILEKAAFDGITINFCLHDREWNAYHRIREEQIFNPIHVVYDPHHPTLTAENHYHFVLYQGTEVVCVAQIEFLTKEVAVLRALATDEPYKNQGFGTYMMKTLEKWLALHGRKTIKMHANLRAEHFYRKLGYHEVIFEDPSISDTYTNLGKDI